MPESDGQQGLRAAFALHQAGRLADAEKLYRRLLESDPNNPHALHYLGVVEASMGNLDRGKSLMARSIEVQPSNLQFLENYATILSQCGDYEAALQICQLGLQVNDRNVSFLYVSAVALYKLKRLQESIGQFDKLLGLQPNHVVAINERGSVLADMNNHEAALESFRKAVAIQPEYAEGHLNSGNLYGKLYRYDEALAAYDKALTLKPALADAWLGRGNVLVRLRRYEEASIAFNKALTLKPDLSGAWLGRGNLFAGLRRHDDAFAAFDRASALDPALADAWLGRGNVLAGLGRYEEALAALDRACELKDDFSGAWLARGNILIDRGRYDEAFLALDRALTLEPDAAYVEGARLYAKMHLCDWTGFDAECAHLESSIVNGIPTQPFVSLACSSSAAKQRECAAVYSKIAYPVSDNPIWRGGCYNHDRIRVAYLSADFHEHATAFLAAGLFEQHDKSRFEVTGISFGPDDGSTMRLRLRDAFERFVEVRDRSDESVADLMRQLEVDIAVDLKGFTAGARPSILARRPAPIQISYLGYPGTMAADYIDYIVADSTVIPQDHVQFYAEKVIWLPNTYQVNDNSRGTAAHTPTRSELGLPEAAFVFCCFNSAYKFAPRLFDIWMRLLQTIEGSVLWLLEGNPTTSENLCSEAEKRGVLPRRLIFAAKAKFADHLARQRHADLFLDTLPYNAHTTASDALWAGLPVVTCLGSTFAGRVAASLLKAVSLERLITKSLDDYEALALKLARDRLFLGSLKVQLAGNRDRCPLFDTQQFARHLEAGYVAAYEREQAGLAPDHIVVPR
jgi:predicted O-linked N-acetylglucosamine transferase (SPINDLY family)